MIDQLAGTAIPASALETLVLPGRVPGYSPALIDELTAAANAACEATLCALFEGARETVSAAEQNQNCESGAQS